jgi:preprotein translocase SecE subunit
MIEQDTAVEVHRPKSLGLDRWVQIAFMAFALLLLWLLDKIITLIWDRFAEPTPSLVTLLAAAIAIGTTLVLYRQEKVSRVAHEVVGELTKVSWPSRRETQVSTLVVIITSVIAAIIVGSFDAVWSAITDLIYKA